MISMHAFTVSASAATGAHEHAVPPLIYCALVEAMELSDRRASQHFEAWFRAQVRPGCMVPALKA